MTPPKQFAVMATLIVLAAPAWGEDLTFTLTNKTSQSITHFFTSPTDVDNWEEDLFNGGALDSNSSTKITIADGREQCDYDLKFQFGDGSELVEKANLCDTAEYTVSEN